MIILNQVINLNKVVRGVKKVELMGDQEPHFSLMLFFDNETSTSIPFINEHEIDKTLYSLNKQLNKQVEYGLKGY